MLLSWVCPFNSSQSRNVSQLSQVLYLNLENIVKALLVKITLKIPQEDNILKNKRPPFRKSSPIGKDYYSSAEH